MPTLFVSEWLGVREAKGGAQAPYGFIKSNNVSITAGSVQSNVFDPNCSIIELGTDAVCSYEVGRDPTASATDMRLPADTHSKFISVDGGKDRIATIQNT